MNIYNDSFGHIVSGVWRTSCNRSSIGYILFSVSILLILGGGHALAQTGPSGIRAEGFSLVQPLKIGGIVTLKSANMLWDIDLLNDGSIGTHVVVEIGVNYIVVQDISAITRSWIPLTALRSINWTRIPAQSNPSRIPLPPGPWPAPIK